MLKAPQKLPSAEAAAARSMPEAQMAGRRLALAEKLLSQHVPARLLPFMFGHGHAAAACQLLFPPAGTSSANGRLVPEEASSGSPVTDRQGPSRSEMTNGFPWMVKSTCWEGLSL